jgi:predicted DNA-binding transcriptional regulator AlpA
VDRIRETVLAALGRLLDPGLDAAGITAEMERTRAVFALVREGRELMDGMTPPEEIMPDRAAIEADYLVGNAAAARYLGIVQATIHNYIRRGDFPSSRKGPKNHRLWKRSELDEWNRTHGEAIEKKRRALKPLPVPAPVPRSPVPSLDDDDDDEDEGGLVPVDRYIDPAYLRRDGED